MNKYLYKKVNVRDNEGYDCMIGGNRDYSKKITCNRYHWRQIKMVFEGILAATNNVLMYVKESHHLLHCHSC